MPKGCFPKLILSACLLCLCYSSTLAAKEDSSKKEKRVSIFPFPVIYYAPETRFVFGAAGNLTFRFKKDDGKDVRPSTILLGAAYTQNKQILSYLPYKIYYDEDKYYFFGEVGYYKYSFFFFGTGTNEVPEELYSIDLPRLRINATYEVLPHLYTGIKYQFDNYDITERKAGGKLADMTVPGWNGSVVSGIGPQFIYDTREHVLYPEQGMFGQVSFVNYGKTWGGNFNYNRFIVDWVTYHSLTDWSVLALNNYNSFVFGNAPFQQQSVLGGNKKMRGYYEGRYIDKNQVALQAEYRMTIYKRIGAAIFADAAVLGNQSDFLRFNTIYYTGGAGLRVNINKQDKLNIRLDYAVGPGTSGIYFTVGEAF